mmetsp:Transcript_24710/g.61996  ORF Transcript_24710/g.61996 Transcript_24710/m.61996 type:complete len:105 (+) Transcript_24710:866-1180(+)
MAGTPVALTRLPTCETKGGLHCGGIREFLIKESRLRKGECSKRAKFFSAMFALWFAMSALWSHVCGGGVELSGELSGSLLSGFTFSGLDGGFDGSRKRVCHLDF